jgi:hypothetical protein
MTETDQCSVETRKDGTKICSLHKQPLVETTMLEHVPEGKPYPEIASSFLCPVSEKVITVPRF